MKNLAERVKHFTKPGGINPVNIKAMAEAISIIREYQQREKIAREALEYYSNSDNWPLWNIDVDRSNTRVRLPQTHEAQQALKQLGDIEVKDGRL